MNYYTSEFNLQSCVTSVRIPRESCQKEKVPAVARTLEFLAEEEGFMRSLRERLPLPRKLGRANP